jgi:hypothetical protein
MCNPALIGVAIAVVGAGVGAYSSIEQGKAAAAVAKDNERVSRWQAKDALLRGQVEESRYRRRLAQFKGMQRTRLAASGVVLDQGSALDVLEDTAAEGEFNALTIRANAEREAYGFTTAAAQFGYGGKIAKRRGYTGATQSLLGAASSITSIKASRPSKAPSPKGK